jgi:hypothetical protein
MSLSFDFPSHNYQPGSYTLPNDTSLQVGPDDKYVYVETHFTNWSAGKNTTVNFDEITDGTTTNWRAVSGGTEDGPQTDGQQQFEWSIWPPPQGQTYPIRIRVTVSGGNLNGSIHIETNPTPRLGLV